MTQEMPWWEEAGIVVVSDQKLEGVLVYVMSRDDQVVEATVSDT